MFLSKGASCSPLQEGLLISQHPLESRGGVGALLDPNRYSKTIILLSSYRTLSPLRGMLPFGLPPAFVAYHLQGPEDTLHLANTWHLVQGILCSPNRAITLGDSSIHENCASNSLGFYPLTRHLCNPCFPSSSASYSHAHALNLRHPP